MNKKHIAFVIAAFTSYNLATAQRFTDKLDFGAPYLDGKHPCILKVTM